MGVKMLLTEGHIDVDYQVEDIRLDELIQHRLESLGLTEGTTVRIVGRKRGGTAIIKVRGSRLALGKAIIQGIFVTERGTR